MKRRFSFSDPLVAACEKLLLKRGVALSHSSAIADSVKKLSDHYIQNPLGVTPWNETWAQVAYLAYYVHLNEIRNRAVYQEAHLRSFPGVFTDVTNKKSIEENTVESKRTAGKSLVDFGSGLGSGSWNLLAAFSKALFIERDSLAQKLHRELLQEIGGSISQDYHWASQAPRGLNVRQSTVIFSYSLTELTQIPDWLWEAESLIILEPSTLEDGKRLLGLRQALIEKSFSIWAPCPHQLKCPLQEGKKDWCHDRVHVEAPSWFLDVEAKLPFKNQTVTYSYLLAHREEAAPNRPVLRVVGDPLREKGKTRQMICRNEERQFLAWMSRHHSEAQALDRGDLIQDDSAQWELKQNEWRVPQGQTLTLLP